MLGMNIWLRQQQTLYTKCISESVFGLLSLIVLFLAVEFFRCAKILCLMLIFSPRFLVSCYRLAKARPEV